MAEVSQLVIKDMPDGTVEIRMSGNTNPPGATGQHGNVSSVWFRVNSVAEFRELRDRTRVSDAPHAIIEAAAAGRIHKVCLRAGTELQSPQGDVLNAIAVETIRKGGTAYLLPQEEMPVTQAACAILRY